VKFYLKFLVAILVLAALILPAGCSAPAATVDNNLNKAVIVDQLSLRQPNPEFIAAATHTLESYGFTVDVWKGADITVDFYHRLPSMGYRFILLRVHSGLLVSLEGDTVKVLDTTYLFTAENYSTNKYVGDQLADRVSNAVMEDNTPLVFAINSEFIKRANGKFNNSIILAMGCESYKYDDMPAAFIEKGAAAYVGWSDVVSLEHVDDVTLDLLNNLCSANMTLSQGIASTLERLGKDPYFGSYLKYFPSASGNSTVAELIRQPSNEK
jgi:hypothetical protein